jgi:hypothetical protein
MLRRIELSGDDAGNQAPVGGKNLVGGDHGKTISQEHDDSGVHTRQGLRKIDVLRDLHQLALGVVVPMDAEQIERVRLMGLDGGEIHENLLGDIAGLRQLGEGGEQNLGFAETPDAVGANLIVDNLSFQP